MRTRFSPLLHRLLMAAVLPMAALQAQSTGRIAGKVLGPLREPVPAARVWLEDADGAQLAATIADGSGWFVFGRLASGRYRVRATVAGGNIGYDYADLTAADPEHLVRLRIGDAARIRGTVTDGDGKPIAGALLVSENDVSFDWYIPEFTQHAVADAQGRFELDPVLLGPTTVRAWAPGHAMAERRLHVSADATTDLQLGEGRPCRLHVKLSGATAEQIAAARLQVHYQGGSGERIVPPSLQHRRFDAAGRCAVEQLWPVLAVGSLFVDVPGCGVAPERFRFDEQDDQQAQRTVEFRVSAREQCRLQGQLRDLQGQPLPAQLLVCSGAWPAPTTTATTDEAGRFAIDTRLPAGTALQLRLASETLVLDAAGERRCRGSVAARLDPANELVLTAVPAARVQGRVVAADGRPVGNVEVQLRIPPSYYAAATTATDAQGRFSFARLDGRDTHPLLVHVEEEAGFAHGDDFTLVDGGVRELPPLSLRPPASIDGIVHGADGKPLPGAFVVIQRCDATGTQVDGFRIETVADRHGRFRFVGLEPRWWRVSHHEVGAPKTRGAWFELRAGVAEHAVLDPAR